MIAVECLTFAYRDDGHPVVVDLDYRFAEAAVTAVTGPSGSGKSTLLYLLGLLLTPQSGAVRFDGSRASEWSDRRRSRFRAREVGFVFQDAALDPTRTVLENVCEPAVYAGVPAGVARSRGRTLLERFGVDLPPGRRPGQISGGQAQRVALCRALVAEPQVLLADEPTGNLDAAARDMVFASLRSAAAAGTCVVIATHDPGLVDACDEVLDVAQA